MWKAFRETLPWLVKEILIIHEAGLGVYYKDFLGFRLHDCIQIELVTLLQKSTLNIHIGAHMHTCAAHVHPIQV